jgi:2-polyprenyl-6-methoxyphenol hydroxylase-like FAD-dependent oxidoreductase
MSPPEIDILIIGAGPTGLTLALELASQTPAPSFHIIESSPSRSDKSRAFVLHPRTLELLARHGTALVDKLIPLGVFNGAVRFYAKKAFVYEVGLGEGVMGKDTRYSQSLMISQAETEGVLEEALSRFGTVVERGVRAESLVQDDNGVTCILKTSGEGRDGSEREEEVRCKYVVGCDGAHSIVRKSAGMKFEGGVYPQDFILADVHMKWEQKACFSMFLGSGFLGVFPLNNGIFRLIVSRAQERGREDEPTLQDFKDVVDEFVPGKTELYDPEWITRFRLHHRMVDCYRKGRCFVAGDAAHIHSPVGGQGMNTGMQDAVNLAWKLGSVLRGQSNDAILDSYDKERSKVGMKLLYTTDRLFEMMATSNPVVLWLRNTAVPWIIPWTMSNEKVKEKRFRFVSQLEIRYRESPIVGQASSWNGQLKGGDRAPDGELSGGEEKKWLLGLCTGMGFHLLLFSGIGDASLSDENLEEAGENFLKESHVAVKIHKILTLPHSATGGNGNTDTEGKIHDLYGFKEPGYVLVRPDGYISFIGLLSTIDELKRWVKR